MAYFAKLGENNIIEKVEAVANDIATTEEIGQNFLNHIYKTNDVWKKTSYNTRGGVHYVNNTDTQSEDQSQAFRKNFAGIGFTYDESRDAFIPPKPYASWVLDETTCLWESPVAYPSIVDDEQNPPEWNYIIEWNDSKYQADNTKGWQAFKSNDELVADERIIYDWNGTSWVQS